jgi:hypothetical protein
MGTAGGECASAAGVPGQVAKIATSSEDGHRIHLAVLCFCISWKFQATPLPITEREGIYFLGSKIIEPT